MKVEYINYETHVYLIHKVCKIHLIHILIYKLEFTIKNEIILKETIDEKLLVIMKTTIAWFFPVHYESYKYRTSHLKRKKGRNIKTLINLNVNTERHHPSQRPFFSFFYPRIIHCAPISRSRHRWIIKSALLCKRTYVGKIHFRRLFVPLYRVGRVSTLSVLSLSPPPANLAVPLCKAIPSTGIAGQLSFPRQNKHPWRPSWPPLNPFTDG